MNNHRPYIIEVEQLRKSFNGKPAVNNIQLKVSEGEIFGFLGPNGGGKTTTIRMLCGLLTPDHCEGRCLGFDILREAELIKEQVGYMTQAFSLYEELTIRENLDFMGRLYQIKDRTRIVDENIRALGLQERQHQLVKTLSGGWKQRLSLTAAMLHNPRLLLLDEPTAGVDPQARREFWEQIHHLAAGGVTVLVSTHYMDEAERCHRLAYINRGQIVARGTKEEIIKQSGLITWAVNDDDIISLIEQLKGKPGIDQMAPFGNTLHISGKDAALLNETLRPLMRVRGKWREVESGLEDIFIHLVQARDSNENESHSAPQKNS
jgi:ABC-2 type transport system ATP-binding protein